ncbi:hypothetical protein SAMD00023353_3201130 [Rosellinia necatrix]|uniref:Uncharacterized protein n=1 Tax=Rosellinia necatrix TaxID=77044 RepID=A0A1S8A8T5_ROSNE|nr:hypothetical protein SAMD00023353_3201130 [Rosellinia necatrix]
MRSVCGGAAPCARDRIVADSRLGPATWTPGGAGARRMVPLPLHPTSPACPRLRLHPPPEHRDGRGRGPPLPLGSHAVFLARRPGRRRVMAMPDDDDDDGNDDEDTSTPGCASNMMILSGAAASPSPSTRARWADGRTVVVALTGGPAGRHLIWLHKPW